MARVTVIGDENTTVEAEIVDQRVLLEPRLLPEAIGWALKPEGLCRDDTCVPVRDRAALFVGEQLDLAAVGAALGRPSVVDADAGMVAIALDRERRRDALQAPGGARVHARRPRRHAAPTVAVAGPEATAPRVLVLVRLPLRPARVAGHPRRAA